MNASINNQLGFLKIFIENNADLNSQDRVNIFFIIIFFYYYYYFHYYCYCYLIAVSFVMK